MVDEEGLCDMWACVNQDSSFKLREKNKRLVLFAPEGTVYEDLKPKLNRCIFEPESIVSLNNADTIIRIITSGE